MTGARIHEPPGPGHDGSEQASLRPRVAAGVRWGAIDQTTQVVVRFVASLVMAHLLVPREVGLFALAMVVGNLAGLVVGLGMSDAIIQRRDLDPRHVSTSFTISLASGVLLGAGIVGGSPWLGRLLGDPDVSSVLVALSAMVVLNSIERTPNDMLVRSLLMRQFYLSSTIATVASAVVGVTVAALGGGVWSLVAMALTEAVLATGLAWTFAISAGVWRPVIGYDGDRARSLVGFGMLVTGDRLASYGRTNFDNLIVGRVLGADSLGYYSLAYRTVLLPIVKVSETIGATAFSAFSAVQHDLERLRRGVHQANRYLAIVCLPATIGLAVSAKVLVPVLLGDQWRPAIPIVEALALGGPALSFTRLETSLYNAVGRPSIGLAVSAFQLVLVVPAYLIGAHWGVTGVAVAVVITAYLILPVVFTIRARFLRQTFMDQIAPLVPMAVATVTMAGAALLVREWLVDSAADWVTLLATVAAGTVAYAAVMVLVARDLLADGLADLRGTAGS